MQCNIVIELQPFNVPNFVLQKRDSSDTIQPLTFRLSEIDASSLSQLCDKFRAEVFKKAGKTDPAHQAYTNNNKGFTR